MRTTNKRLDKVLSLTLIKFLLIIIIVFPGASDFSQKYHLNPVVNFISCILSGHDVYKKHQAAKKKKS